ncbi:SRPBCC domain-containing protein [Actinoplanes sp. NPDC000266]
MRRCCGRRARSPRSRGAGIATTACRRPAGRGERLASPVRAVLARALTEPTITWRLEPEGSGTRLFLVHGGFVPDSMPLHGMGKGWLGLLRRIEAAAV